MKVFLLSADDRAQDVLERLQLAGYTCEVVVSAQQIPVHKGSGLIAVLCQSPEALLECHHPTMVPIFFSDEALGVEDMLLSLSNGALDCWSMTMPIEQIKERGESLMTRLQRTHLATQRARPGRRGCCPVIESGKRTAR